MRRVTRSASEVKLHLKMAGSSLELTVSDNGAGFDVERYRSAEERKKHFGLMSMEERASLVGGSLDIETSPGRGTRIRASFPMRVEAGTSLTIPCDAPSSAAARPA